MYDIHNKNLKSLEFTLISEEGCRYLPFILRLLATHFPRLTKLTIKISFFYLRQLLCVSQQDLAFLKKLTALKLILVGNYDNYNKLIFDQGMCVLNPSNCPNLKHFELVSDIFFAQKIEIINLVIESDLIANLDYFKLFKCNFNSTICNKLLNIPQLTTLSTLNLISSIDENNLMSLIGSGRLLNLKGLNISLNNLSSKIITVLRSEYLPQLESLICAENEINLFYLGQLLKQLPSLKSLEITSNSLTEYILILAT